MTAEVLDTKNGPVSPAKKHTGPSPNHLQGTQMTSPGAYLPPAASAEHDDIQDRVEADLIMYRAGWEAGLKTYPPCAHLHGKVTRTTPPTERQKAGDWWDGYQQGQADLVHAQLVSREEGAKVARELKRRLERNKNRAWFDQDCECVECAGVPADGWCRCTGCQLAGLVGERVFRYDEPHFDKVVSDDQRAA